MKSTILLFSESNPELKDNNSDTLQRVNDFAGFLALASGAGGRKHCTAPELFSAPRNSYVIAVEGRTPDFLLRASGEMAKKGIRGHVFIEPGITGGPALAAEIAAFGHIPGPVLKSVPAEKLPRGKFADVTEWRDAIMDLEHCVRAAERCALMPWGMKANSTALRLAVRAGSKFLFTRKITFNCKYVSDCLVAGVHPAAGLGNLAALRQRIEKSNIKLELWKLFGNR